MVYSLKATNLPQMQIECVKSNCFTMIKYRNQRMQDGHHPLLTLGSVERKRIGLFSASRIGEGELVAQYVGEVILGKIENDWYVSTFIYGILYSELLLI